MRKKKDAFKGCLAYRCWVYPWTEFSAVPAYNPPKRFPSATATSSSRVRRRTRRLPSPAGGGSKMPSCAGIISISHEYLSSLVII